jgi:short-subunit dehydrogenase
MNKIAIITGASKGLGKAIAMQLAAENYMLLLCARGELSLYNTVQEIINLYPNCVVKATPVDVSNKQQVTEFAIWCLQFGTPNIVVNNAGQFLPGSIATEADGVLEHLIETNVYSAYYLTKALLPSMMAAKQGHIFNICSIASLQAYSNGGSYGISKFALMGFSKNLREELKPYGIKVTAVYPGATYTDSWKDSGIEAKRMMEDNDVATLIVAATKLSAQAVVEDIMLRPQLGDV